MNTYYLRYLPEHKLITMRNCIAISLLLLAVGTSYAQETIGAKLEALTTQWDAEAEGLSSYEGLTKFCTDQAYRNELITTMKGIHHYDSVLYDAIAKKARFSDDAEIKKTLKDIEKLQSNYSIRNFLVFLQEECKARSEIEKEAKKTGENMDGEAYILELELQKYVKHVTKQIDSIRDHLHHLHIK